MTPRRKNPDKYISHTPDGFRAQIRIRGKLHRQRFKKSTETAVIKSWILRTQLKHIDGPVRKTGHFDDDARTYLAAVAAMPTYADRAKHIEEWIAVFGRMRRTDITSDAIRAQLHRWRTEPRTVLLTKRKTDKSPRTRTITLSASAVNKRRTALMHLFTVLDGKSAHNPVKDVPKFREPDALPKGLPYDAIAELWKVMGDTATRARLQVIAYTGIPHASLKQIRPEDVQGDRVIVRGRQKGAGTVARVVPLTSPGILAFNAMHRNSAWGKFSNSQLRRDFRAACAKVPALKSIAHTLTTYDLRHSFGTEVYRVSGDMRATQVLMGHSSPTLTHRYTLAAVDPRVAEALKNFGTGHSRALSPGTKWDGVRSQEPPKRSKPKKSGAPAKA